MEAIDAIVPYCERLVTGGEPLNTLSNAGFFLVSVYGFWLLHQDHKTRPSAGTNGKTRPTNNVISLYLLAALPAMIGFGSSAFHAKPTTLTHMLDIVPVCLFALLTLLIYLLGLNWGEKKITLVFIFWLGATALAAQWPEVLAHSLFYLPTVVVLAWVAYASAPPSKTLTAIATLFAAALFFRALDIPLCELEQHATHSISSPNQWAIPGSIGTHFLWHLLTTLASALCLRLVIPSDHKRAGLASNG